MEAPVILVVEDIPLNMTLIVSVLNRLIPEASILEASDGLQAIEVVERIHVDLILMDIQMPNMDGIEATTRIRLHEARHGTQHPVPIVALTAYTLDQERARCLAAGMDDFIAKPINKEIIRKIISKYVTTKTNHIVKEEKNTRVFSSNHFDLKGVVDRTQVEEEIILPMAKQAAEGLTSQMQTLSGALPDKNADHIKKLAHAIKGVSLNLGFNILAQLARRMEAIAYEDPSRLDSQYKAMEDEVRIIQQYFQTHQAAAN